MKRLVLTSLVLVLLGTACSGGSSDLEQARRRWEAAGIADYTYTIVKRCFCPPIDGVVVVAGGEVTSVTVLNEGSLVADGLTVEQLFDRLQEELASSDRGEYTIEYHPDLGYPVRVTADPIRLAIDDEYSYEIVLTPGS